MRYDIIGVTGFRARERFLEQIRSKHAEGWAISPGTMHTANNEYFVQVEKPETAKEMVYAMVKFEWNREEEMERLKGIR